MSGGLYLFHRLSLELASVVHDGGEEWIGSARSVRYGFPRGSPLSSDYEAPRTLARISTLTGFPSVDRLLADDRIAALIRDHGRPLVLEAVRDALDEARAAVAAGGAVDRAEIEPAVATCVHAVAAPSLIPLFNLTGTVLHTNARSDANSPQPSQPPSTRQWRVHRDKSEPRYGTTYFSSRLRRTAQGRLRRVPAGDDRPCPEYPQTLQASTPPQVKKRGWRGSRMSPG